MGGTQASKYDETYKALVIYFGIKYDQRIYHVFQQKYANVERSMILKPTPPMIEKVVHEATIWAGSDMHRVIKSVIDKREKIMQYIRLD